MKDSDTMVRKEVAVVRARTQLADDIQRLSHSVTVEKAQVVSAVKHKAEQLNLAKHFQNNFLLTTAAVVTAGIVLAKLMGPSTVKLSSAQVALLSERLVLERDKRQILSLDSKFQNLGVGPAIISTIANLLAGIVRARAVPPEAAMPKNFEQVSRKDEFVH